MTCDICGKPCSDLWHGVARDHRGCQRENWRRNNLDIIARGVRIAVKLGFSMPEIIQAHDDALAEAYGIPVEAWQVLSASVRATIPDER